jgi:hypothetical protein
MTKKEFEKWKRLCYEKSEVELRGYIYIHKDCPLLTEEEKNKKWKEKGGGSCQLLKIIMVKQKPERVRALLLALSRGF